MVAATETLDELSETTSDSRSAEIYEAFAGPQTTNEKRRIVKHGGMAPPTEPRRRWSKNHELLPIIKSSISPQNMEN